VVAAVGAVLLLVSLFLEWYKSPPGHTLTAWTSFEVLDLVLAALAVVALMAVAERFGYPAPVPGRSLTAIGLVTLVIVVSQLLNHPPIAIDRSPEVGAWLALGSAILIAAGGLTALSRIQVELVVDRQRDRDGNGDQAPDTSAVEAEAAAEAAAEEAKVERDLYPKNRGEGPLGADDPEPFRGTGSEEETRKIE
jgi:hypothetical protein